MSLAKLLPFRRGRETADGTVPAGEREARERDAANLVAAYQHDAGSNPWPLNQLADRQSVRSILRSEPALQIAVVHALFARMLPQVDPNARQPLSEVFCLGLLSSHLLRRPQPYTTEDVRRLLDLLVMSPGAWRGYIPVIEVLRAVDRWTPRDGFPEEVRADLLRLRAIGMKEARYADERKALALIDVMLSGRDSAVAVIDPGDDWGALALAALNQIEVDARKPWLTVLAHAATASGTRPTKPWLKRAKTALDAVGEPGAEEAVVAWLGLLHQTPPAARPAPDAVSRYDIHGNPAPTSVLTERNATLVKGLIWCCIPLDNAVVAAAVGEAAEAAYKKIPGVGARSTKVGNAGVYALGTMSGLTPVARLQRLRQRVKLASAQSLIEEALARAAERAGMTPDDLEDLAAPTLGLTDGVLRQEIGPFVAEVVVVGVHQVEVRWRGEDGSPRRSEPAAVKRDFPAERAALKRTVDELRAALPAQRDRLERLLLTERSWVMTDWRARFLDHPLLSVLARRLIWSFAAGERTATGAWRDGALVDAGGQPLGWIDDQTRVRLWHPVAAERAVVEGWQLWLERHEVVQPFKQAHREVYPLTDAERTTATYSNRFAAHILRQHQLRALCQQRGWAYRLQGGFDGANAPTIALPAWNLSAEFWVEGINEGLAGLTESGIALYVATDQVRFTRHNSYETVPLAEVPPLVISEVMRDVDLFVGVCSVGNDPTWADRGPDGYLERLVGYWQDYAFGELGTSATTRRSVLERLLPRLAIAERCALTDKFLVVRGDRRTYRIHLGSGNILMDPNNQYLCIVPKRGGEESDLGGRVFLPFEGDGLLSVILSKAFLLANDTAIKDPTITRQIEHR